MLFTQSALPMSAMSRSVKNRARRTRSAAAPALAAAAALGAISAQAMAQDCSLSVRATPNVVFAGQSAGVDVLAHFPSNLYAFASAKFDVHATLPRWSFASSGAINGPSVLGMNVSQPHAPRRGVFADPANPYRVWRGVFTPTTNEPTLVEIKADPSAISVYPDRRTPSWAPGVADGGSDWLFVNPLRVGAWLAAPSSGTQASTCCPDDVIVDGTIITGENPGGAVRIGLLLPAIQKVPESAVRVTFDDRPETLSATVQVENAQRSTIRSLTVTFESQTTPNGGRVYGINADIGGPSGTPVSFDAFLGGVRVATGDLNGEGASLWVDRVPDGIAASSKPTRAREGGYKLETVLVTSYSIGGHSGDGVRVFLPGGRVVMADTITVKGTATVPMSTNIRQIGLGSHVFEATGVRSMAIEPRQPR